MTPLEKLYYCPVCDWDPWNCTCLRKEQVRRIAFVIGYPVSLRPVQDPAASERLVPAVVPQA